VDASKADLKSISNKLKEKENEIAKALAAKLEKENETSKAIEEVLKQEEVEKSKMCSYYDIDRFDFDYLSDAVVFFDKQESTRSHSVSITTPGERRNTMQLSRKEN